MADALKKVVSVLLQKGGVGKTAVTANTAFEAARMGLNVLFVDSDPTGYGSELLTNEGYLDGLTLSDCVAPGVRSSTSEAKSFAEHGEDGNPLTNCLGRTAARWGWTDRPARCAAIRPGSIAEGIRQRQHRPTKSVQGPPSRCRRSACRRLRRRPHRLPAFARPGFADVSTGLRMAPHGGLARVDGSVPRLESGLAVHHRVSGRLGSRHRSRGSDHQLAQRIDQGASRKSPTPSRSGSLTILRRMAMSSGRYGGHPWGDLLLSPRPCPRNSPSRTP